MLTRSLCALAPSVALTMLALPAHAEPVEDATPFRTAEAQAFAVEDLQRYGLIEEAPASGVALQERGYEIVALTPEEAEAYRAGSITQTEWIILGLGALLIIVIT